LTVSGVSTPYLDFPTSSSAPPNPSSPRSGFGGEGAAGGVWNEGGVAGEGRRDEVMDFLADLRARERSEHTERSYAKGRAAGAGASQRLPQAVRLMVMSGAVRAGWPVLWSVSVTDLRRWAPPEHPAL
jgi:hypothetical protein